MSLKNQIDADLKVAMLSGDKTLTETLRGLKSAILNVEIATGNRDKGLSDDEIIGVLTKEAKKRQESADLFAQGGNQEKSAAELKEKTVIQEYLPAQMSEDDIRKAIDEVVNDMGEVNAQQMGQIIGAVKQKAGAAADGAVIARLVKERLQ
jgi:uncharacterized protein